jgi:isopenicillin N synthase-like dioxygenase
MEIEGQTTIPLVSVKSLTKQENLPATNPEVIKTCNQLLNAAKEWGFVYISDHGVSHELLQELENISKEFFALPVTTKMKYKMLLGGKAWRGYFPPGGELTSGVPDIKEGMYFGTELELNDTKNGTPLHGQNLFPDEHVPKLRPIVLEYLTRLTALGHGLMRGFAIGLELQENYFKQSFGNDPTILFRIFNYPKSNEIEAWGVQTHTDYGFLTILKTDDHPGLQILNPNGNWIDAPPNNNAFIVNLGDQLEIATKGFLKATPHRVKIQRDGDRLSWPFFFDPDWEVGLSPVKLEDSRILRQWIEHGGHKNRKPGKRWDGKDLLISTSKSVTYGEYLMGKVSKCFPELFDSVL